VLGRTYFGIVLIVPKMVSSAAILLVALFVVSVSTTHVAHAAFTTTISFVLPEGKVLPEGYNRAKARSLMDNETMTAADPTPKYLVPRPPLANAIICGQLGGNPAFCPAFPFLYEMCPLLCGIDPDDESYCSGDKNLAMEEFWDFLGVDDNSGQSTRGALSGKALTACQLIAPGAAYDVQVAWSLGNVGGYPCSSAEVALLCPDSCNTNCWTTTATRLPTTKVYLPSCRDPPSEHPVLDIATQAHRAMRNKEVSGVPIICPP